MPIVIATLLLVHSAMAIHQAVGADPASIISAKAAESCQKKVKALVDFGTHYNPKQEKTTPFTENEVNSYLALQLSPKFSPGLNSLALAFEEDRLHIEAVIDSEKLGTQSTSAAAKFLAVMLPGIHKLTATGKLIAAEGKAHIEIEDARFDGGPLPALLIHQIITFVGKMQNPPFDPLQPTEMPYRIKKVDIRNNLVMIYQ